MRRATAAVSGIGSLLLPFLASAQEKPPHEAAPVGVPTQTVVVEGEFAPRVAAEPEVSASVVKGEPLKEPGADVADVLSRSPGVQVNRTGTSGDLSTVSIRGLNASQVPVYFAGIRLNDDIVGVADLSRLPLWMVDRVEVYRGATPLDAGRAGMNGALVFEPTLPSESGYRFGSLAGSYGSGAVWAGATAATRPAAASAENAPHFATSVSVRRAGAMNDFTYDNDSGTAFEQGDDAVSVRQNADYLEDDLWVISRGRVPTANGAIQLSALYNHFSREQGVSGLALLPAEQARAQSGRDLLGVKSKIPCRLGGAECDFELATSVSFAGLLTTDPEAELSLGAAEVDQKSTRLSQEAHFDVDWTESLSSSLGGIFEASHIHLDSPDTVLARASENYFGAAASLGYSPMDEFLVRGVIRASCVDAAGVDAGVSALSLEEQNWSACLPEGRLGASLRASESLTFRSVVNRGVRFPTLGERFGVSAVTRGNALLEVEQAWAGDIGATIESAAGAWGSYWLDAAVFGRWAEDLIAFRRSSLGYVRPFNVGSARFLGGELAGELTALGHFRTSASVSLLDPRDTSADRTTENNLIPFRSQITASEEFEVFTRTPNETVSHLGLIGYVTYRSGRVADPAGLIVIPQQVVVDVASRVQLLERYDLRARVENLLGSARFDAIGFPLPGRAFFLSVEYVNQ